MSASSTRARRRSRSVPTREVVRAVALDMARTPIGKLGLRVKVPEFCHRMGWPEGEHVDGFARGHAFVAAAVSCYAAGAIHQRLRIPDFMTTHPTWAALVAQYSNDVDAAVIVECLSPSELPFGHANRLDTILGIEAKRETLQ